MSQQRRALAGLGIVLASVIASVLAYPDLPQQVAIHFDSTGTPDDYLSRTLAVALLPAFQLAAIGLYAVVPRIDPLGENFEAFEDYYDLAAVLTVAVLGYVHLAVLGWNLGYRFEMGQVIAPVVAAVAVGFGYVVENARQNWFVGIRTPWTLSDEEVWARTHERSGVLFKIAGLVALLAIPFPEYFEVLAVGPLALAALLPTVYSYILYRQIHRA